jgi:hypothetical protein
MPESSPEKTKGDTSLLERVYLPFLLGAHNADGGWGYRSGGQSAVEPTSWVLLALKGVEELRSQEVEKSGTTQLPDFSTPRLLDSWNAGVRWLRDSQLPDGSWPSFASQPRGCWVTAAASLALYVYRDSPDRVARGLRWLAETWPVEGRLWRRIGAKLLGHDRVVRMDFSLRGWSWTPGTASWVEPTSCALLAFRHIPQELHPRGAERRRRLAERMLFDRMCPGGGWNSGNPLVYGAAGVPRIGPTVWALLALQDYKDRPETRRSLDWLELAYSQIEGPGSLALAHLCLQLYNRAAPVLEPALAALNSNNQFLGDTLVAAWAAMALGGMPRWLSPGFRK